MRLTTLILRSTLAAASVIVVCAAAPAETTQPMPTTSHALPAPAVVSLPRTFSAATYARPAVAGTANDERALPQGQFVSPAHTYAERSSLLDQVTRERYREAMALNAVRGEGKRITFRKARF